MLISHADTIVIDAQRRALLDGAARNRAWGRDENREAIRPRRPHAWTSRLHQFTRLVARFVYGGKNTPASPETWH